MKAKKESVFEMQDSTLQTGLCYIPFSEKHERPPQNISPGNYIYMRKVLKVVKHADRLEMAHVQSWQPSIQV